MTGFTYLGVRVSPHPKELWRFNFAPIIVTIKTDLDRWHDLPMYLMGHISLIKINVFPRLLYPLQLLLLWLTRKVAADLERAFSKFIWQGRRPNQKITAAFRQGGMALPNIIFTIWLAMHVTYGHGCTLI